MTKEKLREYHREYAKKYFANPENRRRKREIIRKSISRPEYKEYHKNYIKKWTDDNREKVNAYVRSNRFKNNVRQKLRYHVSVGHIKKLPCEVCGEEKVQGHHKDYNKPLEVVWLCKKHHAMEHRIK